MAVDLEKRLEDAAETLITAALPGEQVLTFGETEKKGANYFVINFHRVEEDPKGSGIFSFLGEVKAHGQFTQPNIDAIDTVFSGGYALSDAMRTAGVSTFAMPQGEACEILGKTKTGVGNDAEYTWNFGCWAQTKEISDGAA